MYTNLYPNMYNPQTNVERINNQIAELEKLKSQITQTQLPQPTNLTQNFQLAPSNQNMMRYANSIDEIQKENILNDTPFFSKDMSVLWIKNTKNEIKTYELTEIIPKDNKDLQIEYLQAQIEDLKKGMKLNERNSITYEPTTKSVENEEPADVSAISKSTKKSK